MTKFVIRSNYGMMPNQIEGETDDGRFFYFRGRWDWVSLHISKNKNELYDNDTLVFDKETFRAGWLSLEEFESLFWQVIKETKL